MHETPYQTPTRQLFVETERQLLFNWHNVSPKSCMRVRDGTVVLLGKEVQLLSTNFGGYILKIWKPIIESSLIGLDPLKSPVIERLANAKQRTVSIIWSNGGIPPKRNLCTPCSNISVYHDRKIIESG